MTAAKVALISNTSPLLTCKVLMYTVLAHLNYPTILISWDSKFKVATVP